MIRRSGLIVPSRRGFLTGAAALAAAAALPDDAEAAYNFTAASSQYVQRTTTPITAVPLTMACWFRQTNFVQQSLIYLGNNAGTAQFLLQAQGTTTAINAVVLNAASGSAVGTGAPNYALNTWTHAAATFTSDTSRRSFKDGAGGVLNTANIAVTGVSAIAIGTTYLAGSRSQYFGGDIAEVGIWNAALGDDEILQLSKGYSPRLIRPSALVFYAPLARELVDLKGDPLTASGAVPANHPRVLGGL